MDDLTMTRRQKIVGFIIIALLAISALHPNNRYPAQATQSDGK